jgi:hypothetical protein
MNIYKYKVISPVALEFYKKNGMEVGFPPETLNGVLIISAPNEDTAELMRKTFTDITMWERIQEHGEHCDNCGATGEGTSAWDGWCHDCDNQLAEINPS